VVTIASIHDREFDAVAITFPDRPPAVENH
jgi:hypothetical protein